MVSSRKVVKVMYAIKFFHGYLTPDGTRTRIKSAALLYNNKEEADRFADSVGGRVKKIE